MNPTRPPALAQYARPLQPLAEVEALGQAGGLSGARFWRFRAEVGPLVLKSWPPGTDPARVRAIHRWLDQARESGLLSLPHPNLAGETVAVDDSGAPWDLSPWLPGTPLPPRQADLPAAARALASLHRRWGSSPVRIGPSPGLIRRAEELRSLQAGGISRAREAISRWPDSHPTLPLAREWLELAEPRVGPALMAAEGASGIALSLQPCFRDLRGEHLLFGADRQLSGIVDYGAMDVESIAGDLARLATDWLGGDPALANTFLDAYSEIRPLDGGERRALAASREAPGILIGKHWLDRAAIGEGAGDPSAIAGGFRRAIALLKGPQKISILP